MNLQVASSTFVSSAELETLLFACRTQTTCWHRLMGSPSSEVMNAVKTEKWMIVASMETLMLLWNELMNMLNIFYSKNLITMPKPALSNAPFLPMSLLKTVRVCDVSQKPENRAKLLSFATICLQKRYFVACDNIMQEKG